MFNRISDYTKSRYPRCFEKISGAYHGCYWNFKSSQGTPGGLRWFQGHSGDVPGVLWAAKHVLEDVRDVPRDLKSVSGSFMDIQGHIRRVPAGFKGTSKVLLQKVLVAFRNESFLKRLETHCNTLRPF